MENKKKYTPGPWSVSGPLLRRGVDWNEEDDAPRWVTADHTVHIYVQPCSDGFVMGQNKYNALLIAASPDLLGALEMMCDMFLQDHRDGHEWPQYKAARAVIAKAKGEKI